MAQAPDADALALRGCVRQALRIFLPSDDVEVDGRPGALESVHGDRTGTVRFRDGAGAAQCLEALPLSARRVGQRVEVRGLEEGAGGAALNGKRATVQVCALRVPPLSIGTAVHRRRRGGPPPPPPPLDPPPPLAIRPPPLGGDGGEWSLGPERILNTRRRRRQRKFLQGAKGAEAELHCDTVVQFCGATPPPPPKGMNRHFVTGPPPPPGGVTGLTKGGGLQRGRGRWVVARTRPVFRRSFLRLPINPRRFWGRTVRCARAVRKVGRSPPPGVW